MFNIRLEKIFKVRSIDLLSYPNNIQEQSALGLISCSQRFLSFELWPQAPWMGN
jgi:hypothetical protein